MAVGHSEEELESLQKASENYKPDVSGPLVGEVQSTNDLVEEYADAIPAYKIKTANLPSSYSGYRKCKGDGNCGWRAMAFGYVEALIHCRNPGKIIEEINRLASFDNLVEKLAGEFYKDYTEVTVELLKSIAELQSIIDASRLLLETFNDESLAAHITFHFRLLASVEITRNPEWFSSFLGGSTVDAYCQYQMQSNTEIEEVGIQALCNIIVEPAGLGLEIVDLNTEPKTFVDVYTRVLPRISEDGPLPIIRLLFRPTHYDLIYKLQPEQTQIPHFSHAHSDQVCMYGRFHDESVDFSHVYHASPFFGNLSSPFFVSDSNVPLCSSLDDSQYRHSQSAGSTWPNLPALFPHTESHTLEYESNQHATLRALSALTIQPVDVPPGLVLNRPTSPPRTKIMKGSANNSIHFLNPEFQPALEDPTPKHGKATKHRCRGPPSHE